MPATGILSKEHSQGGCEAVDSVHAAGDSLQAHVFDNNSSEGSMTAMDSNKDFHEAFAAFTSAPSGDSQVETNVDICASVTAAEHEAAVELHHPSAHDCTQVSFEYEAEVESVQPASTETQQHVPHPESDSDMQLGLEHGHVNDVAAERQSSESVASSDCVYFIQTTDASGQVVASIIDPNDMSMYADSVIYKQCLNQDGEIETTIVHSGSLATTQHQTQDEIEDAQDAQQPVEQQIIYAHDLGGQLTPLDPVQSAEDVAPPGKQFVYMQDTSGRIIRTVMDASQNMVPGQQVYYTQSDDGQIITSLMDSSTAAAASEGGEEQQQVFQQQGNDVDITGHQQQLNHVATTDHQPVNDISDHQQQNDVDISRQQQVTDQQLGDVDIIGHHLQGNVNITNQQQHSNDVDIQHQVETKTRALDRSASFSIDNGMSGLSMLAELSHLTSGQGQDESHLTRVVSQLSQIWPSRDNLFIQWQNLDAMCWMDVILIMLVHSPSLRPLTSLDPGHELASTLLVTLLKANRQAQILLQNLLKKHNGAVVTDAHTAAPVQDPKTSKLVCKETMDEIGKAINVLYAMREKIWLALQPRLRCERGKHNSPVLVLPLLVRENPTVKKMFTMRYRYVFQCENCSYTQDDSHSKILPSIPMVPDDFNMTTPCFVRNCFECLAPNQRMMMQFEQLQDFVQMHFVKGLPHSRFDELSFDFNDDHYEVTAFVHYKNNPDHFIAWVRNAPGTMWMECDDLKSVITRYSQPPPNIPPSQVHMVMWERRLTPRHTLVMRDTEDTKLLASLVLTVQQPNTHHTADSDTRSSSLSSSAATPHSSTSLLSGLMTQSLATHAHGGRARTNGVQAAASTISAIRQMNTVATQLSSAGHPQPAASPRVIRLPLSALTSSGLSLRGGSAGTARYVLVGNNSQGGTLTRAGTPSRVVVVRTPGGAASISAAQLIQLLQQSGAVGQGGARLTVAGSAAGAVPTAQMGVEHGIDGSVVMTNTSQGTQSDHEQTSAVTSQTISTLPFSTLGHTGNPDTTVKWPQPETSNALSSQGGCASTSSVTAPVKPSESQQPRYLKVTKPGGGTFLCQLAMKDGKMVLLPVDRTAQTGPTGTPSLSATTEIPAGSQQLLHQTDSTRTRLISIPGTHAGRKIQVVSGASPQTDQPGSQTVISNSAGRQTDADSASSMATHVFSGDASGVRLDGSSSSPGTSTDSEIGNVSSPATALLKDVSARLTSYSSSYQQQQQVESFRYVHPGSNTTHILHTGTSETQGSLGQSENAGAALSSSGAALSSSGAALSSSGAVVDGQSPSSAGASPMDVEMVFNNSYDNNQAAVLISKQSTEFDTTEYSPLGHGRIHGGRRGGRGRGRGRRGRGGRGRGGRGRGRAALRVAKAEPVASSVVSSQVSTLSDLKQVGAHIITTECEAVDGVPVVSIPDFSTEMYAQTSMPEINHDPASYDTHTGSAAQHAQDGVDVFTAAAPGLGSPSATTSYSFNVSAQGAQGSPDRARQPSSTLKHARSLLTGRTATLQSASSLLASLSDTTAASVSSQACGQTEVDGLIQVQQAVARTGSEAMDVGTDFHFGDSSFSLDDTVANTDTATEDSAVSVVGVVHEDVFSQPEAEESDTVTCVEESHESAAERYRMPTELFQPEEESTEKSVKLEETNSRASVSLSPGMFQESERSSLDEAETLSQNPNRNAAFCSPLREAEMEEVGVEPEPVEHTDSITSEVEMTAPSVDVVHNTLATSSRNSKVRKGRRRAGTSRQGTHNTDVQQEQGTHNTDILQGTHNTDIQPELQGTATDLSDGSPFHDRIAGPWPERSSADMSSPEEEEALLQLSSTDSAEQSVPSGVDGFAEDRPEDGLQDEHCMDIKGRHNTRVSSQTGRPVGRSTTGKRGGRKNSGSSRSRHSEHKSATGWVTAPAGDTVDTVPLPELAETSPPPGPESDSVQQSELEPGGVDSCTAEPEPGVDSCTAEPGVASCTAELGVDSCTAEPEVVDSCTAEPEGVDSCTAEQEPGVDNCTAEPEGVDSCTAEPEGVDSCTAEPEPGGVDSCTAEPEPVGVDSCTAEPEPVGVDSCTAEPVEVDSYTAEPEPEGVDSYTAEPGVDSYTAEPVGVDSYTTEPVEVDSYTAEPVEVDSYIAEPVVDSYTAEPVGVDSYTTEPVEVDSYTAEPVGVDSYAAEPVGADSYTTEPEIVDSYTAEPEGVDSFTAEPGGVDSFTAQPGVDDNYTTEPAMDSSYVAVEVELKSQDVIEAHQHDDSVPLFEDSQPDRSAPHVADSQPDRTIPVVADSQPDRTIPFVQDDQPDRTIPFVEDNQPDRTMPFVEDDQPDRTIPVVEDDQPNITIPVVEDDQPDRTMPFVEDSLPDRTIPVVEDDQPDITIPVVEDSQPDRTIPFVEDDQPDRTIPVVEDDQPDRTIPFVANSQPDRTIPVVEDDQPDRTIPVVEDDQPDRTIPFVANSQPDRTIPVVEDDQPDRTIPVEDDQPDRTTPFVEDDQPDRTMPFVEDSQPERTTPFAEDSQPERTTPFAEDNQPDRTAPLAEDNQPDRTTPVVEDNEGDRPVPHVEGSHCDVPRRSSVMPRKVKGSRGRHRTGRSRQDKRGKSSQPLTAETDNTGTGSSPPRAEPAVSSPPGGRLCDPSTHLSSPENTSEVFHTGSLVQESVINAVTAVGEQLHEDVDHVSPEVNWQVEAEYDGSLKVEAECDGSLKVEAECDGRLKVDNSKDMLEVEVEEPGSRQPPGSSVCQIPIETFIESVGVTSEGSTHTTSLDKEAVHKTGCDAPPGECPTSASGSTTDVLLQDEIHMAEHSIQLRNESIIETVQEAQGNEVELERSSKTGGKSRGRAKGRTRKPGKKKRTDDTVTLEAVEPCALGAEAVKEATAVDTSEFSPQQSPTADPSQQHEIHSTSSVGDFSGSLSGGGLVCESKEESRSDRLEIQENHDMLAIVASSEQTGRPCRPRERTIKHRGKRKSANSVGEHPETSSTFPADISTDGGIHLESKLHSNNLSRMPAKRGVIFEHRKRVLSPAVRKDIQKKARMEQEVKAIVASSPTAVYYKRKKADWGSVSDLGNETDQRTSLSNKGMTVERVISSARHPWLDQKQEVPPRFSRLGHHPPGNSHTSESSSAVVNRRRQKPQQKPEFRSSYEVIPLSLNRQMYPGCTGGSVVKGSEGQEAFTGVVMRRRQTRADWSCSADPDRASDSLTRERLQSVPVKYCQRLMSSLCIARGDISVAAGVSGQPLTKSVWSEEEKADSMDKDVAELEKTCNYGLVDPVQALVDSEKSCGNDVVDSENTYDDVVASQENCGGDVVDSDKTCENDVIDSGKTYDNDVVDSEKTCTDNEIASETACDSSVVPTDDTGSDICAESGQAVCASHVSVNNTSKRKSNKLKSKHKKRKNLSTESTHAAKKAKPSLGDGSQSFPSESCLRELGDSPAHSDDVHTEAVRDLPPAGTSSACLSPSRRSGRTPIPSKKILECLKMPSPLKLRRVSSASSDDRQTEFSSDMSLESVPLS